MHLRGAVIENPDLVTRSQQLVRNMRSDEAPHRP